MIAFGNYGYTVCPMFRPQLLLAKPSSYLQGIVQLVCMKLDIVQEIRGLQKNRAAWYLFSSYPNARQQINQMAKCKDFKRSWSYMNETD